MKIMNTDLSLYEKTNLFVLDNFLAFPTVGKEVAREPGIFSQTISAALMLRFELLSTLGITERWKKLKV